MNTQCKNDVNYYIKNMKCVGHKREDFWYGSIPIQKVFIDGLDLICMWKARCVSEVTTPLLLRACTYRSHCVVETEDFVGLSSGSRGRCG